MFDDRDSHTQLTSPNPVFLLTWLQFLSQTLDLQFCLPALPSSYCNSFGSLYSWFLSLQVTNNVRGHQITSSKEPVFLLSLFPWTPVSLSWLLVLLSPQHFRPCDCMCMFLLSGFPKVSLPASFPRAGTVSLLGPHVFSMPGSS